MGNCCYQFSNGSFVLGITLDILISTTLGEIFHNWWTAKKMTVASPPLPCCGDAVASSPVQAPATLPRPPSPRSPLPERRAVGGSRFWALADESSDEEDEPETAAAPSEEVSSVEAGPSQVTFGDFLSPAWQKVTALKSGGGSRRRGKFAPGERGSRFGKAGGAPPPRSRSGSRGGAAAQSTPVRPPSPKRQGAAAGPSNSSMRFHGPVSSPAAAVAGEVVGGASPVIPVVPGCQGLGVARWLVRCRLQRLVGLGPRRPFPLRMFVPRPAAHPAQCWPRV
jgi:hypothetical protein